MMLVNAMCLNTFLQLTQRSNKKEEQEENSSTFNGLLVGGMRRADENKRSRTYAHEIPLN